MPLGDEIMVLEDFSGDVPGTLEDFSLQEVTDYPEKLFEIDDYSVCGCSVLESTFSDVVGPVTRQLLKNLKARSKISGFAKVYDAAAGIARAAGDVSKATPSMVRQSDMREAHIAQIVFAAKNPRAPLSIKIVGRLFLKAKNLEKLSAERTIVAKKATLGYERNKELVRKIDATQASDASLQRRRSEAETRAVRYAKLNAVATMMARNAKAQATLTFILARAVKEGDVEKASEAAKKFAEIGRESAHLKKIRKKQVKLWKVQNDKGEYMRLVQRRIRLGKKALLLEMKRRETGLTPEQTKEKNDAIAEAHKLDNQMSNVEKKVSKPVKLAIRRIRAHVERACPSLPVVVHRWGPPDFTPAAYYAIIATRTRDPGYVGALKQTDLSGFGAAFGGPKAISAS